MIPDLENFLRNLKWVSTPAFSKHIMICLEKGKETWQNIVRKGSFFLQQIISNEKKKTQWDF